MNSLEKEVIEEALEILDQAEQIRCWRGYAKLLETQIAWYERWTYVSLAVATVAVLFAAVVWMTA